MNILKTYNQFINESKTVPKVLEISDADEHKAFLLFDRALGYVASNHPYFFGVLLHLKIRSTIFAGTMAVDGISLFYSPLFVLELGAIRKIAFVLCHEAMHVLCQHMTRQADRDNQVFNAAADFAINLLLVDSANKSLDMPKHIVVKKGGKETEEVMGLLDESYRNLSAEEIYDLIYKDWPKKSGGGGGGGIENCPVCNGTGEIEDNGSDNQENQGKEGGDNKEGGKEPGGGQGGQEGGKDGQEGGKDGKEPGGQGGKEPGGHGHGQGGQEGGSGGQGEGGHDGHGHGKKKCPCCDGKGTISTEVPGIGGVGGVFAPGSLQGGKDIYKPLRDKGKSKIGDGDKNNPVNKENVERRWTEVLKGVKGDMPAGLSRGINRELGLNDIDWVNVFMDMFENYVSTDDVRFSHKADWSSSNASPIYQQKGYATIPLHRQEEKEPIGSGVIVFDTSGSISDEEINKFASELKGICMNIKLEFLYLLYCDAAIHGPQVFINNEISSFNGNNDIEQIDIEDFKCNTVNVIKPQGGGGTDFRPPFEWIRDHIGEYDGLERIEFVIYFTDAVGTMPKRKDLDDVGVKFMFWVVISDDNGNFCDGYIEKLPVEKGAIIKICKDKKGKSLKEPEIIDDNPHGE